MKLKEYLKIYENKEGEKVVEFIYRGENVLKKLPKEIEVSQYDEFNEVKSKQEKTIYFSKKINNNLFNISFEELESSSKNISKEELIKAGFEEYIVDKYSFSHGLCVEFAIALKEELEKVSDTISFKDNIEYGLVGIEFLDEEYDLEDDEDIDSYKDYEYAHACLTISDNLILDIDGLKEFVPSLKEYGFSNNVEKESDIKLFKDNFNEDDLESAFGEINTYMIFQAKRYIEKNNLIEKIKEDYKKLLSKSDENNISQSSGKKTVNKKM
jgi:hypothetical protein